MARIAGVDLPLNKRIEIALTYIYGIGLVRSRVILKNTNISPDVRVKDLSEDEVARLQNEIRTYKLEGDLRREVQADIKRLIHIGAYRGLRHRLGLPVRGQRTRTNARTRKGKRKTIGTKQRKEEKGKEDKA